MKNESQKILHLYNRAGFGISPENWQKQKEKKINEAINEIFQDIDNYENLKVLDAFEPVDRDAMKSLPEDERKMKRQEMRKKAREEIKTLNTHWLSHFSSEKAVLREKMTLFWHGHFACESKFSWLVQTQNNTIRKYALGNFRDLVLAISKDPAMLLYLNNQQNKKASPNENYARELMELFTIGIGNYTENDIKEAARAFTGWGVNRQTAEYVFRQKQHDFDEKAFMGKTGDFNGEDIIDIILEKEETAQFITSKIYRYFVNPVPNENRITSLAQSFYNSDYDILALMREIFESDWFYEEENRGVCIKSPVELIASFQLNFGIEFLNPDTPLFIQKILDQILFFPPNVAGWKGGKSWIDSSSLMFRLKMAELFFYAAEISIGNKEEEDVSKQGLIKSQLKKMEVTANWESLFNTFQESTSDVEILFENLCDYLILTNQKPSQDFVTKFTKQDSTDMFLKTMSIALASTPEYQMR